MNFKLAGWQSARNQMKLIRGARSFERWGNHQNPFHGALLVWNLSELGV
jgi:hypothetical protein